MKYLSDISTTKAPWLLLAVSALALELSALFFQYGLKLDPCIMCIYQRVALWGVFIAAAIGSAFSHLSVARLLAYSLWAISAIWGLLLALEHFEIQSATLPFLYSCEFVPNFPSWAPLHEWIPFLFEATGDCGDIDWQFLGFTMPQVMILVFALYSLSLITVVVNRLFHAKKL